MAYIFDRKTLPRLVSVVPGRERVFLVNEELAGTDEMLCGIMQYDKTGESPYHMHENCEHFYYILEGRGTVETETETRTVQEGDLVYFKPEEKHKLSAAGEPLAFFEYQTPNRFKTVILKGSSDNLRWKRIDGKVWVQS